MSLLRFLGLGSSDGDDEGRETATVRRIEWSEGYDDYNTPLHVGATYTVYDEHRQPRCRLRLTAIELARWGASAAAQDLVQGQWRASK